VLHVSYISVCVVVIPDVSEDVRIFSTVERGSEWKAPTFVFTAHFLLVLGIMLLPRCLLALLSIPIYALSATAKDGKEAALKGFFGQQQQGHTNNWAVLVCTSRYWFNYRVRILG
jgi:hypothetical protein